MQGGIWYDDIGGDELNKKMDNEYLHHAFMIFTVVSIGLTFIVGYVNSSQSFSEIFSELLSLTLVSYVVAVLGIIVTYLLLIFIANRLSKEKEIYKRWVLAGVFYGGTASILIGAILLFFPFFSNVFMTIFLIMVRVAVFFLIYLQGPARYNLDAKLSMIKAQGLIVGAELLIEIFTTVI